MIRFPFISDKARTTSIEYTIMKPIAIGYTAIATSSKWLLDTYPAQKTTCTIDQVALPPMQFPLCGVEIDMTSSMRSLLLRAFSYKVRANVYNCKESNNTH